MNKNTVIAGVGVKAAPGVGAAVVEQYKPRDHGELLGAEEPTPPVERPILPIQLRTSGLTHNLDAEDAAERYGVWRCLVLKQCWCHGVLLREGDHVSLTGDVVQQLVGSGRVKVSDPKLAEENSIIDRAVKLGLPTKVRELVNFAAKPKRSTWKVQPESND